MCVTEVTSPKSGAWVHGVTMILSAVCVSEGTSPKSRAWVHGVTMILSAVCVCVQCVCVRGHKPQVWSIGHSNREECSNVLYSDVQEEEERKRREEKERQEHEEYLKLKEAFSVEEEGEDEGEADLSVSKSHVYMGHSRAGELRYIPS